ncbi:MAG: ATP-binding protein [Pseudomonadota bacterium]
MSERILLFALRGRDADVLAQLLRKAGHAYHACATIADFARELGRGAGAAVITEESLGEDGTAPIADFLDRQEPWSDFPFVLLATKRAGRRPELATQMLEMLGNVVVLERPIHSETLTSAVRSALRVRRRQYEARRHLLDIRKSEERQAELNNLLAISIDDKTAELDRLWTLSEDMLARANYQGGLSAVSPAWTTVLGYSEQRLLGRPYSEIIHPDDVSTVIAALNTMRQTGEPTRFENRILAADGEYRPIGWTVSPEPDGVNFIAIGRNLSAEKAREADLRESQDQLRQSQKMEAVGQLTGGIAHDFNNLLQGITGSLDIVQKRISQGKMGDLDRWITGAVSSANRAAALTHRLLAFSRRQPLDPKPVGGNPLIASMEDLLQRTMGENIDLELALSEALWPTLCDANQLESAILNLAINARDAMPDGGKLTIETCNTRLADLPDHKAADVKSGEYVCIAVSDTGTGMPPDVIERAFDPFFTTKAIGQGTGLGLSMIYGFARQSGGNVKIYSEMGIGTTIKLFLPRHDGEVTKEPAVTGLTDEHAAGVGEVVVVIDDEPVVRGLIVEVLGELGYRALEAEDGAAGLALLESAPRVDLLVTDIGLPGLNGRQVADAARTRLPNLKVLFMTGYAENAAVANGFLDPGMSMITKPFAMESLATRIRAIIEGE